MGSEEAGTRRAGGTRVAHRMMREVNRSLVLDILRRGEPVSRVELARRTGLSKPTVSSIVEDLLTAGLVREPGTTPARHRTGRPPSLLLYNERAVPFAAIQFGVNTTRAAIADGLGNLIATATTPAVHGDPEQSIRDARRALRQALARSGVHRDELRSIGVAVPGLVDVATGRCILAPNLDWHDVPLGRRLQLALGLPVVVTNPTHAAAMAEARLMAEDNPSLVWVYAGSGVGAGIVVDGALHTGARGFAGEFGHAPAPHGDVACSCGNRGCLETVAGTAAIVRRAAELGRGPAGGPLRRHRGALTAEMVLRLAADGDAGAAAAVRDAGEQLGRGIAYLVNIVSPGVVVLGGPLPLRSPEYAEAARQAVARHALQVEAVPVRVTALGPNAPLLGAVQLAMGVGNPSYRVVDNARVS